MYVLQSWMNIDAAIMYHSVPAMALKQAPKVGVSVYMYLPVVHIYQLTPHLIVSLSRTKLHCIENKNTCQLQ